jgi:hypothetical protein
MTSLKTCTKRSVHPKVQVSYARSIAQHLDQGPHAIGRTTLGPGINKKAVTKTAFSKTYRLYDYFLTSTEGAGAFLLATGFSAKDL